MPSAASASHVGERHASLTRISRDPRPWTARSFGPVEWLDPGSIDPAIARLLPTGLQTLTPTAVAAADALFGTDGRFPAVHLATGELRGLINL